ncbi:hypothetical protein [Leifsonia shinshuensis]|uniref:Uncharacterized protein n=1 Tax=Leifsonia shinshuensis TaxID=150026 RepID=A0A7G6YA54_9MICO|nr:hypothetical protein [Leifsonia shinshuensis]QNE35369.1 hypothetical protein F1C12_09665 [Leifsonia shinshuensis]
MTELTSDREDFDGTNGRAKPVSTDEVLWVIDWIEANLPLETTYDVDRHDDSAKHDGGWYVGGLFRNGVEVVDVVEIPGWERARRAIERLAGSSLENIPQNPQGGYRHGPWTTWFIRVHDICARRPVIEAERDAR